MIAFTTNERLALLLSVLGEEAATTAFEAMHPTRATYLRKLLNEFQSDPPSPEEVNYVIGDFNQYFQFAMQTWGPEIDQANSQVAKKTSSKSTKSPLTYFPRLTPTNDPIADLNRLDPFQIAQAIAGEIQITLGDANHNSSTHEAANSPKSYEAYDLYLKGLYFWNKRTPESFPRAVEYFQNATSSPRG